VGSVTHGKKRKIPLCSTDEHLVTLPTGPPSCGQGRQSIMLGQPALNCSVPRFTQPQEVADLVLVLARGRAGNVIGASFVVDGGRR
jgi:NAD(P)-dependent dehydrogenase (short-subunit alcohol dehydrogenase family)